MDMDCFITVSWEPYNAEKSKDQFLNLIFQINEEQDLFEEVFDDDLLNWFLVTLYILGLVSCIGLIMISWFEKSGQAGTYRSLVNQLVSMRLDQVHLSDF